jgi:hypothetical protein
LLLTGVLLCGLMEGQGETGAGCGAALRAVHPWQGEARAVQGQRRWRPLLQCRRRKKRWLGRVGPKAKQAGGAVGPIGAEDERNSFQSIK